MLLLLDLLIMAGKIRFHIRKNPGHREKISKYLNRLADKGVLKKQKKGKTNYFINWRLMELIAGECFA